MSLRAPPRPSQAPMNKSGRPKWYLPLETVLISGAALKLVLFLFTPLPEICESRIELATPLTGWKRLQEGVHLFTLQSSSISNQAIDPYTSPLFHHPPMLLLFFSAFPTSIFLTNKTASAILWTALDVGCAWLLGSIARRKEAGPIKDTNLFTLRWKYGNLRIAEDIGRDGILAAIYLLHPFSLLTSMARSTIIFTNLATLVAIWFAYSAESIFSAVATSFAIHFGLYPVFLVPSICLILYQTTRPKNSPTLREKPSRPSTRIAIYAITLILHQIAILTASSYLMGNWNFLDQVWGVMLKITDLTPNIGLSWYFFIEMFDHFRDFFLAVFTLHLVSYVAPVTLKFRHNPMFAVTILVGLTATFKAYPSFGDVGFFHSLLTLFPEIWGHLRHPLITVILYILSLLLLPTFRHLWIYAGSGNANFYYASTLVWGLANGAIVIDSIWASLRTDFGDGIKDGKTGEKLDVKGRVGDEKDWVVVQK